MSKVPSKSQQRNKKTNTNPPSTQIVQTPSLKKNSRKNTKKVISNDDRLTSSTPAAATVTTITAKRKPNFSPTSPDTIHSAKKSTSGMANSQITMDQIGQLFAQHTSKIASDMQAQMIAHTDTVKNEIKMQLDAHTTAVQNEIKSLGDQLKSELSGQIDDVNKKIDVLQNKMNGQLVQIQKNVDGCMDRLNFSEDDVRRNAKLNELKIKGIPYTAGENLHTLFENISQFVGYNLAGPNCMPELNRMQIKNNAVNERIPIPTIIVKFVAKHIRDNFYSLYLSKVSKKPLSTEDIKLAQGGRVIISENLTTINQQLFIQAMKMKFDKKLFKVFTKDGLVQVKKTKDSKPKIIRISRELDLINAGGTESIGTTSSTQTTAQIENAPAANNASNEMKSNNASGSSATDSIDNNIKDQMHTD